MGSVYSSLHSLMSIIILIGVGWYISSTDWYDKSYAVVFSKIVTQITLPCTIISTIYKYINNDILNEFVKALYIPLLSIALTFIVAYYIISKFASEIPKGLNIVLLVVSNTIFIGLPVNEALFGKESIPFALMYYLINTLFFWTIGVYLIKNDTGENKTNKFELKRLLEAILSPPLVCIVISLIIVKFSIVIPESLKLSINSLGNITTPLSLIYIGLTLSQIEYRNLKVTYDKWLILFGRFVVSPIIMILIVSVIPIPLLMKKVFVIQSSLPIMAQTATIAKEYNSNAEYASVMVSISTILGLVIIPIYFVIVESLF